MEATKYRKLSCESNYQNNNGFTTFLIEGVPVNDPNNETVTIAKVHGKLINKEVVLFEDYLSHFCVRDVQVERVIEEAKYKLSQMLRPEHWYDIWSDTDGQEAYLSTDIPPEDMYNFVHQWKGSLREIPEDGYDVNDFIEFLRNEKSASIMVVNRPSNGLNLND